MSALFHVDVWLFVEVEIWTLLCAYHTEMIPLLAKVVQSWLHQQWKLSENSS